MPGTEPYLRQLLRHRTDWIEQRLYARADEHGFGDITPAMTRLFTTLAGRPQNLSELARRLGVSRQAVHRLASDAAELGYVAFEDIPGDARAKRLTFTARGRRMAELAEVELKRIEASLAAQMGAEQLNQLKALLALAWTAEEAARAAAG